MHEIISEPDAWIQEIPDDNPDTGVFPPYGQPVAIREDLRTEHLELNPGMRVTGLHFSPTAQLGDDGSHTDFSSASGEPPNAEDKAEIERIQAGMLVAMRSKPRYRHLFIASDTHMLEILCAGPPRCEWVE